MTETTDLYTAKDIAKVREYLYEEQHCKDALTGLELPTAKWVADHRHDDEQFVRGVIHRSVNACLGRIENSYVRDLAWWYPDSLPTFLRKAADYLEKPPDTRYRHNSWLQKVKVFFNKLSSKQQNFVLESLCNEIRGNPKERKELFAEIVLDRSLGYARIVEVINQAKELA